MMAVLHFQKKGGGRESGTGTLLDRRKRLWSPLGMPRAARIAPGGNGALVNKPQTEAESAATGRCVACG